MFTRTYLAQTQNVEHDQLQGKCKDMESRTCGHIGLPRMVVFDQTSTIQFLPTTHYSVNGR